MRKVFVIVETGEVRLPKKGEYFIADDGNIIQTKFDLTNPRTILTCHVIESDKALGVWEYDGKVCANFVFSIPAVIKSKVKKWRWAYPTSVGIHITPLLSEDEMKKALHRHWYHKIDETETEVEE